MESVNLFVCAELLIFASRNTQFAQPNETFHHYHCQPDYWRLILRLALFARSDYCGDGEDA